MSTRKSAETVASHDPIAPDALGFEAAMTELENLIQSVESNRLPLEETLNTYQRGQQLIARCNVLLRDAEQRIQQFNGTQLSDAVLPERS